MPTSPLSAELRETFASIDIYWFDQLLRGRLDSRPRVLDAGCGDGRNLRYLLRRGVECYGADLDAEAVASTRRLAETLQPGRKRRHESAFVVAPVDRLPWGDGSMDAVVCSAVLHFADDEAHFERMVDELWRMLAPRGLFFARLASNIGLETEIGPGGRRVTLPDGSARFVVDQSMLLATTARLGGRLADPLKTTVVQGMRAMTTWCVLKS
jgi:SAM-dependent methyltransferase